MTRPSLSSLSHFLSLLQRSLPQRSVLHLSLETQPFEPHQPFELPQPFQLELVQSVGCSVVASADGSRAGDAEAGIGTSPLTESALGGNATAGGESSSSGRLPSPGKGRKVDLIVIPSTGCGSALDLPGPNLTTGLGERRTGIHGNGGCGKRIRSREGIGILGGSSNPGGSGAAD